MNPKLANLTDWPDVGARLAVQQSPKRRPIKEADLAAHIKSRVRGQDHIVDDMARLLRLQWAKESRSRPIANILFLGPTGTGKTEMCKALAEYLYKDEKTILRFDCSELGLEAKNHLIGSPAGYEDARFGGKLTRPMISNSSRIVLFDEVEKAHPPVMDLFLQMMGEGRLTEQASGQVANFTEAVIILTSNAEADAISRLQTEIEDQDELVNAAKSHLASSGIFRPEIIGRIDRVYVFKPLEGIVLAEIAALKMINLAREYGLELVYVDPQLIFEATQRGSKSSKFGARGIDGVVNEMLGEALVMAKDAGARRVRLEIGPDGVMTVRKEA